MEGYYNRTFDEIEALEAERLGKDKQFASEMLGIKKHDCRTLQSEIDLPTSTDEAYSSKVGRFTEKRDWQYSKVNRRFLYAMAAKQRIIKALGRTAAVQEQGMNK